MLLWFGHRVRGGSVPRCSLVLHIGHSVREEAAGEVDTLSQETPPETSIATFCLDSLMQIVNGAKELGYLERTPQSGLSRAD